MSHKIFEVIEKNDFEKFKELLRNDIDAINAKKPCKVHPHTDRDYGGQSPLHTACHFKRSAMAFLLIENKAKIDALDGQRCTLLHIAAKKGAVECIKILLAAGAKIDALDMDGRTPLHKASWHWRDSKSADECDNYQKTVVLLVSAGTNVNLYDRPQTQDKSKTWPSTTPIENAIASGQRKPNYQHTTQPQYTSNVFKFLPDETIIENKHKELLQALGVKKNKDI